MVWRGLFRGRSWEVLATALSIFLSMALRDFFGSASTSFIASGRRLFASISDGLCDIAGLISFTGAVETMLSNGYLSWPFAVACIAVLLGSGAGTYSGMAASALISGGSRVQGG